MDDLEKRIQQFKTCTLPGQPMIMHMGTSYLVNDLWKEVLQLRIDLAAMQECRLEDEASIMREQVAYVALQSENSELREKIKKLEASEKSGNSFLDEALNSGDGVYRP